MKSNTFLLMKIKSIYVKIKSKSLLEKMNSWLSVLEINEEKLLELIINCWKKKLIGKSYHTAVIVDYQYEYCKRL